jgi:hypothetical protein
MLVAGDDGSVSSLDLQSGQVRDTAELGGVPVSLTSARGNGWVATSEGLVVQIGVVEDQLEVTEVEDLGGRPLRIAPAGGDGDAVWIPDTSSPRLTRIETVPPNNSATVRFPDVVERLSTVDPRVVIAVTSAGEVYRIDANDPTSFFGEPERIDGAPVALVAIEGAVVLLASDDAVYRIELEPSAT